MEKRLAVVIAVLLFGAPVLAQTKESLPLMPWPARITTPASGAVNIDANFILTISGAGAADPRVKAAAQRTLARLARQTGLPIRTNRPFEGRVVLQIIVERCDHKDPQKLGDDESYALKAASGGVQLTADGPLGVVRGLETFLQLVQQNRSTRLGETVMPGFSVPYVDIHDQPRFPWRGLSLDVSRHFIPIEEMKRTIDGLAAVKLNVLH